MCAAILLFTIIPPLLKDLFTVIHFFLTDWLTVLTSIFMVVVCLLVFNSAKKKYSETKSQQVLTSVPGICTAWGIFWTFVSIVLSLGKIVATGENLEDFSIFNITGSLIPAFLTSVIGMSFSIFYSGKIKDIIAEEECNEIKTYGNPIAILKDVAVCSQNSSNLLNGLNQTLRKHFEASLLVMSNIESDLAKQTTVLQNLNSDFNKQSSLIHSDLSPLDTLDSYVQNINQSFASQNTACQNFLTNFTDGFKEYFSSAHSDFKQHMMDYTTEEVSKYMSLLTSVGEQMKIAVEKMNVAQTEMVDTFDEKYTETINAATQRSVNSYTQALTKSLQQLSDEIGKSLANAQRGMIGNFNDATGDFKESVASLTSAVTEKLSKLSDDIANISTSSLETMKEAANLATSLSQALTKNLQQSADDMRENLANTQSGIVGNVNAATGAIQDSVATLTNTVTEKLSKLSDDITCISTSSLETLKKETDFISDKVGNICEKYEQAQQAYTDALQNVHNSNENWEAILKTSQSTLEKVKQTSDALAEVVDLMKNRETESQNIQREITGIAETITQLQELNSNLTKLNTK